MSERDSNRGFNNGKPMTYRLSYDFIFVYTQNTYTHQKGKRRGRRGAGDRVAPYSYCLSLMKLKQQSGKRGAQCVMYDVEANRGRGKYYETHVIFFKTKVKPTIEKRTNSKNPKPNIANTVLQKYFLKSDQNPNEYFP